MHTFFNVFFSDITTYNLVILTSFITTGLASFLLCTEFAKNLHIKRNFRFWVCLVASLFPTLAPIRIHHLLVGHRNGFLFFVSILLLFLVERQIHTKVKKFKSDFLIYSHPYYSYFSIFRNPFLLTTASYTLVFELAQLSSCKS
jgi:hypothetical protein